MLHQKECEMKKIISQMMVSLDGFYEGKNHELDWHKVDVEHNDYAIDIFNQTSTLLFGRKTYQLMEQYWPTEQSKDDSQLVADRMNQLPKVVFSRTLEAVNWNETVLVKDHVTDYLHDLKRTAEKDLMIIGSGELVSFLTDVRLIDEYQVIVSPIILGEGKKFLENISHRVPLNIVSTRTFKTGNVLLCYQVA